MDRSIEIVPAIKRLELRQVGCWEHLDLEFCPGLNIITEEGSAWGKTTIFKAILYSLIPTYPLELRPTPSFSSKQGSVSVEFMSTTHRAQLQSPYDFIEDKDGRASSGEFMLRQLRAFLVAATPNMALLIEDEVTAILDTYLYEEAVKLLNSSNCQIICQIAHRLKVKNFPKARVYACYMGTQNKARIKLQQAGDSVRDSLTALCRK